MRKWLLILLLALAGVSCDRTLREESAPVGPGEGEVTIHFTLPYPEVPATRSLAENMELHSLYVAVFGSSGFFKEYKKAQLLNRLAEDYIDYVPVYGPDGETVVDTKPVSVPQYEFSVTLTLSEKSRQIHFLGNGPDFLPSGTADQVLPSLLCEAGEGAFWQMIRVSKIGAEKVDGVYVTGPDGAYVPDDDTKAAFREIALIRNWAKIELDASADSNFTPISFAVVNKPSRGSIVPYSANTKFIEGYQNLSFRNLNETLQYPGNLPSLAATTFDTSCPSEADFKKFDDLTYTEDTYDGGRGVVARYKEGNAVYLYERTVPSESISPTYVIIYGHYKNLTDEHPEETEGDYFYKVDLMEGQSYYPIFRNFKYRINIRKILAPGQATPELAATAAGSADVSSDIITQHLLDISDGTARLIVSPWIAQTFTKKYDGFKDLKVKFLPDMSSSVANDGSLIELQLIPEDGGVILDKRLVTEEIDEGWIPISITTSAPTDMIRTQTLRVIGHYPGWPGVDGPYLYRDIQITVQNKQEMRVTCTPRVLQEKGTPVTVTVSIPDGLVQSMFPLVFTIEAEAMTLEPDISVTTDNNLPVTYGESISEHADYVGKQAYQFLRTLSWEEYRRLKTERDSQNNTWRYFNCYFRANQDDNVTTIWVDNDQYFIKAHCDYQGYSVKRFNDFQFTSPIPLAEDVEVSTHFTLQRDPYMVSMGIFPEILVRAKGLTPNWDGWWPGEEVGTYLFTPTTDDITLPFHTTTNNGDIWVELSAEEYQPARVTVGRFNQNVLTSYYGNGNIIPLLYGIVGGNDADRSNSAYGYVNNVGGKAVIFGYFDDPDAPLPAVTLKYVDAQGNEVPLSNKTNPSGLSSSVAFPWKPTGPKSNSGDSRYHELTLNTIASYKDIPVYFILSANGYVDFPINAERFRGNSRIHTLKVLNNNYLVGSNVNFQDSPYVFSGYDTGDYGYMQITIEPLDVAPAPIKRTSAPKGIVLGADSEGATVSGARYRVHFNCSGYGSFPNQKLFCTMMVFSSNSRWNGVTYKSFEPASMTPTTGIVYHYPGNAPNYWMWQVSDNTKTNESIEMVVGDCPIIFNSFVVRTFSGSLY